MILGPLPLDYEIHQGEGLPLHAHINARLYPYSNVAGTLNLPSTLLQSAAAIRNALGRHSGWGRGGFSPALSCQDERCARVARFGG